MDMSGINQLNLNENEMRDFEVFQQKANLYNKRADFKRGHPGEFERARKLGWIPELCKHMEYKQQKPTGYWTKARCLEEAKKFNARRDFQKKAGGAYNSALNNGWLDDVCMHMKQLEYQNKYCVYVIQNDLTKQVYVGITRSYRERMKFHRHENNTSNSRHITSLQETKFIKASDYIYDTGEAAFTEEETINAFAKIGYNVLNSKKKIGALGGGVRKWTEDALREEVSKHHNKSSLKNASPGAYKALIQHSKYGELTANFSKLNSWGYDECKTQAQKYKTRAEFQKAAGSAYNKARKCRWLDDICSHMQAVRKSWSSFENCKKEALKYKTRSEFQKQSRGAYKAASREKWLDEICQHMKFHQRPFGYWNDFDLCKAEALKYNVKTHFARGSSAAFKAARRNNWLLEICKHMISP